jgi:hypothetical protein
MQHVQHLLSTCSTYCRQHLLTLLARSRRSRRPRGPPPAEPGEPGPQSRRRGRLREAAQVVQASRCTHHLRRLHVVQASKWCRLRTHMHTRTQEVQATPARHGAGTSNDTAGEAFRAGEAWRRRGRSLPREGRCCRRGRLAWSHPCIHAHARTWPYTHAHPPALAPHRPTPGPAATCRYTAVILPLHCRYTPGEAAQYVYKRTSP